MPALPRNLRTKVARSRLPDGQLAAKDAGVPRLGSDNVNAQSPIRPKVEATEDAESSAAAAAQSADLATRPADSDLDDEASAGRRVAHRQQEQVEGRMMKLQQSPSASQRFLQQTRALGASFLVELVPSKQSGPSKRRCAQPSDLGFTDDLQLSDAEPRAGERGPDREGRRADPDEQQIGPEQTASPSWDWAEGNVSHSSLQQSPAVLGAKNGPLSHKTAPRSAVAGLPSEVRAVLEHDGRLTEGPLSPARQDSTNQYDAAVHSASPHTSMEVHESASWGAESFPDEDASLRAEGRRAAIRTGEDRGRILPMKFHSDDQRPRRVTPLRDADGYAQESIQSCLLQQASPFSLHEAIGQLAASQGMIPLHDICQCTGCMRFMVTKSWYKHIKTKRACTRQPYKFAKHPDTGRHFCYLCGEKFTSDTDVAQHIVDRHEKSWGELARLGIALLPLVWMVDQRAEKRAKCQERKAR